MKLCTLAGMVRKPVFVPYASTVKGATKPMIAESHIFNFNCWVSIARMLDPQRLRWIENELLQFQFSPCSDPKFFPRSANISIFP